jgi:4-amino-4-deoxy-L-arabinose transferase-like glycosyltransferase
MSTFDQWAKILSSGDWLTNRSFHPYHVWHDLTAQEYFKLYPGRLDEYIRKGGGTEPGRPLWEEWYGGRTFHQEPLYPYLVGATYAVFGPDPRWVFGWQVIVGALSVLLVWIAGRRFFGETVGALGGALAVLCGPLMYYDFVLLRPTLITAAGLALVLLLDAALRHGGARRWFLLGIASGAAVLLQTIFALYVAGAVAGALWTARRSRDRAVRSAGALALGAALCMAPVAARNVAVGAPPLSLSSVGAVTFISSNAADSRPDEGFRRSQAHGARIMAKTGGRFLPAAIEVLKTHDSPASYARLLWGKFAALWHWYEIPNNTNFYYFRLHSAVLRLLPVTFLVLGPLALAGLLFWPRRNAWPLHLLVLTHVAAMMAFYVLSRFRVPLMAALIPFAALAVERIANGIARRRYAAAAAAMGALVLLALWTMRPLQQGRMKIRPMDHRAVYVVHYFPVAEAAANRGDWRESARVLGESLHTEPGFLAAHDPARPAAAGLESETAAWFATVHRSYARTLGECGDEAAAREQERLAALHEAPPRGN